VRRSRGLRRSLSLAAAALVALALTACQAIPAAGPVREGLADLSQADQPVQFNPGGPPAGASQEEIVRGFVRAASSITDDYAIARQFLAPSYRDGWDPSLGVFVDEGTQPFHSEEGDVGVLSLTGIAIVDAHGTLAPIRPGPTTEARFELEQVDGEWRIVSAPSGVILDKSTFTALWSTRQLYFLSADNRLVPETRWFLNRATLTTQIVGELLAGPSEGMFDALHGAFPAGTALVSSSVPVTDGTAHIDLSIELLDADPAAMELATRQVAASLQSVSGVSRFELSVNGVVVDAGPVGLPEDASAGAEHLGTVVLDNGVFGELTDDAVRELPVIGDRVAALDPAAVSLSSVSRAAPDSLRAAVLNGQGVTWVSDSEAVQLDVRAGLVQPSIDRFGYVWSYATSSTGEILVTLPGETQELLPIPWLAGSAPVAVRVSKSGTRIAVLLADGDQSAVMVAGIVRDPAGRPLAVGEAATAQLWVTGAPVDLDWIDETRFAALTRVGGPGGAGKITIGSVGQFAVDSGTVADAVSLSGAGGARMALRVLAGDGRMYAPQGVGWQRQAEGIELIAKAG
jgi:hypothetical protein